MRIAFLGNRGVPANFGGSDTIFEQLGERLAKKNHKVIVYCRKHFSSYDGKYYKGIERVVLPSINMFNLDTIIHSFLSTLHILVSNNVEILNYHGIGNSFVLPLLVFSKKKSVVLIDGPDWTRPKWNSFAKLMLRLSVNFGIWFADEIISDNIPIHDWILEKFKKDTPVIYYGADFDKVDVGENLKKWKLQGNDYILYIAMMVPDKGPDIILEAYSKLNTDKKLLMVGDTHYHKDYYYVLKAKYSYNSNIIFTGFQYGSAYKEYMSNAYIYVHPFRSDGTSPSLLQSMALGNCIVANSSAETSAALEDAGILFEKDSPDSLAERLQFLMDNPYLILEYQRRSLSLAKRKYDWEKIVTQYENVFKNVLQTI